MRSGQLPVSVAQREPARNTAFLNANAQLGLDLFRQEVAAEAIRTGRCLICAEDSDQPPTFRLAVRASCYVFETRLPDELFPSAGNADLLVLW